MKRSILRRSARLARAVSSARAVPLRRPVVPGAAEPLAVGPDLLPGSPNPRFYVARNRVNGALCIVWFLRNLFGFHVFREPQTLEDFSTRFCSELDPSQFVDWFRDLLQSCARVMRLSPIGDDFSSECAPWAALRGAAPPQLGRETTDWAREISAEVGRSEQWVMRQLAKCGWLAQNQTNC